MVWQGWCKHIQSLVSEEALSKYTNLTCFWLSLKGQASQPLKGVGGRRPGAPRPSPLTPLPILAALKDDFRGLLGAWQTLLWGWVSVGLVASQLLCKHLTQQSCTLLLHSKVTITVTEKVDSLQLAWKLKKTQWAE